jgi:predicted component of type VI protein secretion system
LFEPLDYGSAGIIKSEIREVLERYEPRISVDSILCNPDDMNNGYEVELTYTIIGRDDTPVTVEFFLERTR